MVTEHGTEFTTTAGPCRCLVIRHDNPGLALVRHSVHRTILSPGHIHTIFDTAHTPAHHGRQHASNSAPGLLVYRCGASTAPVDIPSRDVLLERRLFLVGTHMDVTRCSLMHSVRKSADHGNTNYVHPIESVIE